MSSLKSSDILLASLRAPILAERADQKSPSSACFGKVRAELYRSKGARRTSELLKPQKLKPWLAGAFKFSEASQLGS